MGVGGDPKLGGFSNLEYYRRGQHVGEKRNTLGDTDSWQPCLTVFSSGYVWRYRVLRDAEVAGLFVCWLSIRTPAGYRSTAWTVTPTVVAVLALETHIARGEFSG